LPMSTLWPARLQNRLTSMSKFYVGLNFFASSRRVWLIWQKVLKTNRQHCCLATLLPGKSLLNGISMSNFRYEDGFKINNKYFPAISTTLYYICLLKPSAGLNSLMRLSLKKKQKKHRIWISLMPYHNSWCLMKNSNLWVRNQGSAIIFVVATALIIDSKYVYRICKILKFS
jgi:hypothetical protein